MAEKFIVISIGGNQTVPISCEMGSMPIIELFYPCSEISEASVPWAEKNGVARARRIPQLTIYNGVFKSYESPENIIMAGTKDFITDDRDVPGGYAAW